jgi:hypothetical protein
MNALMNGLMSNPKLIAIAIAVALLIVVAVVLYTRKRKKTTTALRQRFGPEYDRAVLQQGSERKAEAKLADREARVEMLKIRDLDLAEREGYLSRWQGVQSRFVDYPKGAVTEADELVCSLMQARGYPVTDFDQRAADISVDHPRVVENYRSGHGVALRLGNGEVSTEELRTAMLHYRSLFDELAQPQIVTDTRVA